MGAIGNSGRPHRLLLVAALCALAFAASGSADWLVLQDGARLETDGPWTERGNLLIFTDNTGRLVSLRLVEVDLEASRHATAEAVEAARRPPPPPPRQESVFRLTDADVGHIEPESEDEVDSPGGAEGDQPEPTATAVQVTDWRQVPLGDDGVSIRGTLENLGEDVAIGISVAVTVHDEDGIALATSVAQLTATGLVAGQSTDLVANFPGIMTFTRAEFAIQHRSLAAPAASGDSQEPGVVASEG